MLVDLRVYTYLPNKFKKFLASYESVGFALTSKHLGRTLGVFMSESGLRNRTFQFFTYEDAEHRALCQARMFADPEWLPFLKLDGDALLEQRNTLLRPLPFSPLCNSVDDVIPTSYEGELRLFEISTFNCVPGCRKALLKQLENSGMEISASYSEKVIGAFVSDTGDEDAVHVLLAHKSAGTRDQARRSLAENDKYQSFVESIAPLVAHRDATLLKPVPYSPLR